MTHTMTLDTAEALFTLLCFIAIGFIIGVAI